MPAFEDADAVAELLAYLRSNAEVQSLLGGSSNPSVSGINEGPWPHLIVSEGLFTDLRDARWEHEQEVALELRSDPNGMPGKAALRKLIATVVRIATEATEVPVTNPNQVVICNVRPSGSLSYQKLSTGQLTYIATVLVTVRPPLV